MSTNDPSGTNAETPADQIECNLRPTPSDPNCPLRGTADKAVTLKVTGTNGSVQMVSAKYNGKELSGLPSPQVTFTIVPGQSDLDVAYGFSDTTHGAGVLREVCKNNTLIGFVNASGPAVRYHICA